MKGSPLSCLRSPHIYQPCSLNSATLVFAILYSLVQKHYVMMSFLFCNLIGAQCARIQNGIGSRPDPPSACLSRSK